MSTFRHRIPLAYPIESRDGTLNADSKMKNMVAESIEGELIAVKRPGVTKATELAPGLAQGLFSLNGVAYAIVDDKLYGPFTPSSGGGSTNNGWVQVPGGTPFSIEPPMFSGSIDGVVVAFGHEPDGTGRIKQYRYSSVDGYSWTRSEDTGGTYVGSGKCLMKDGGLIAYVPSPNDWDELYFGKSSDSVAWQTKIIQVPLDVALNMHIPTSYVMDGLMVIHGGYLLAFIKWTNFYWHVCQSGDGETLSNSVQTSLYQDAYLKKIISHNGDLYAIGGNGWSRLFKSSNNGLTWSIFALISFGFVDCVSTADGILVVTTDNQTWLVTGQNSVTRKDYTLPSASMKNGRIVAIGSHLFMIGCGDSYNTAFKLVDSSAPVGTQL